MPLDEIEDALVVAALQTLEDVHLKVRPSSRSVVHWSVPSGVERALDALRQLRPWWREVERRGLWANVEALGCLDPQAFPRGFGGYPEGADPRKRWLSRLEGALLAGRRPELILVPEGTLPAVRVEVVARLPTKGLIREPANWMREANAIVVYAVRPVPPQTGGSHSSIGLPSGS